MDSDTVWHHIDHERLRLAEVLEGLDDTQWLTGSLCAGWTVRDVAAHLAMAHARARDVALPLLRSGFAMPRMIRRSAVASRLERDEIVAALRRFVGSRRRAPFISELEPLVDVLVHGQDICLPLGIDLTMPPDAACVAADRIVALNRVPQVRLRRPLVGVRLEADDVDWSTGRGTVVHGPVQALVMLVAGRGTAVRDQLRGDVGAVVPS